MISIYYSISYPIRYIILFDTPDPYYDILFEYIVVYYIYTYIVLL